MVTTTYNITTYTIYTLWGGGLLKSGLISFFTQKRGLSNFSLIRGAY